MRYKSDAKKRKIDWEQRDIIMKKDKIAIMMKYSAELKNRNSYIIIEEKPMVGIP